VLSWVVTFEEFAVTGGRRLRAVLTAAYGPDVGLDAASEALAYGWEHWSRVGRMANPAGYLYRVAQTAVRRQRRAHGYLPVPTSCELPNLDPGLAPALEALTEQQRVCVLLVHALGWSQVEVAGVLDIDAATVRTHLTRGLTKLRAALEVTPDAH
jgi:DNA-directed RNA polymerase specialized sigma24 family protein